MGEPSTSSADWKKQLDAERAVGKLLPHLRAGMVTRCLIYNIELQLTDPVWRGDPVC